MITTIIIVMKGGERNKTPEEQVMHSTVAHHSLTSAQPVPEGKSAPGTTLPVYIHDILWYGIIFWLVWVSCHSPAPSQLFVHLPTGRA